MSTRRILCSNAWIGLPQLPIWSSMNNMSH